MSNNDQQQGASAIYRRPRLSTTIDRRRVMRPAKDQMILKKNEEVVVRRAQPQVGATQVSVRVPQKVTSVVPQTEPARPTAKQLKETAIEKALATASKDTNHKKSKKPHVHFGFKRVLLALTCAAAAVFAIVYFVNLNAPNISLKVAAMQTGIEASYPSYVPRDFNLSDITSEDGKITLNFRNSSTGDAFSLIEEKSSWDSNALLNNYVRETYGENYTTMREQGLTLYISGSNASWVNGGIVYKLTTTSGSLTKKQIRAIAVSL